MTKSQSKLMQYYKYSPTSQKELFLTLKKPLVECFHYNYYYIIIITCLQASVQDLNKRMNNYQITVKNFRPNLLVEGPPPYDEDNWEWVKIGNVVFRNVAEYRASKGPSKSPVMGVHLEVRKTGRVTLGDKIYVTRRKQ
nr:unnamed protein product [Callosobruchus analis]